MRSSSRRIGELVVTLQDFFLADPRLALTPAQAAQLCGADEMTCRAILNLLADGGVIAGTGDGPFVGRLPLTRRQPARRDAIARTPLPRSRPALAS
jgi:hypothetical protein